MKIYVVTKAQPLSEEVYVSVHASLKSAEKEIRKRFPNARKDDTFGPSYICKDANGNVSFMFIHSEVLE